MRQIAGARDVVARHAGKQAWPRTYQADVMHVRELRAFLQRERLAGRIVGSYTLELNKKTGRYEATVLQVGQPMALKYRVMLGAAGALSAVAALGWLLWESRYVIGMTICGTIVLVVIAHFARHEVGCPGLHCAGCRG